MFFFRFTYVCEMKVDWARVMGRPVNTSIKKNTL